MRLRIVLTADPYLPVPPRGYGGIERVVALLVAEFGRRGHAVTLVAHPESSAPCARLIGYGMPPHGSRRARAAELVQVASALNALRGSVDLIHSFGRLAALIAELPDRRTGKVQSYQRDGIPWRSVRIAAGLAGRSIAFTACAAFMFRRPPTHKAAPGRWTAVPNCVDTNRYTFRPEVEMDAPLVFLGRIEPIKGVHHAITIAKRARRRLVIAGNRVELGSARGYFEAHVEPHIDGDQVQYVGEVDDAQKDEILGRSAALLMPIEWDEPFGIVMIEAAACGTPTIALRRGSVPEVVRDGVSGFVCISLDHAVASVAAASRLDRALVRADCERRVSVSAVATAYEVIYRGVCPRIARVSSGAPA